jgi:hypothetical protein
MSFDLGSHCVPDVTVAGDSRRFLLRREQWKSEFQEFGHRGIMWIRFEWCWPTIIEK